MLSCYTKWKLDLETFRKLRITPLTRKVWRSPYLIFYLALIRLTNCNESDSVMHYGNFQNLTVEQVTLLPKASATRAEGGNLNSIKVCGNRSPFWILPTTAAELLHKPAFHEFCEKVCHNEISRSLFDGVAIFGHVVLPFLDITILQLLENWVTKAALENPPVSVDQKIASKGVLLSLLSLLALHLDQRYTTGKSNWGIPIKS